MLPSAEEPRPFTVRGIPAAHRAIHVSNGTTEVILASNIETFAAGARLPREPWIDMDWAKVDERPCDLADLRDSVTIYDLLDQGELTRIRRGSRSLLVMPMEDGAARKHPVVKLLSEKISAAIGPIERLEYAGTAFDPPMLPTVSRCPQTGAYVGLHIDTFDRLSLQSRESAPLRLSINVGLAARYFLFLDLPLRSLLLKLDEQQTQEVAPHLAGQAFTRAYPNYPIIRVRIEPGQAYVAATENMVHDGSSAGIAGVGQNVSFRVLFKPPV